MKYGSHPRTDKQQIIVVSCCVHSEHAPAIKNPLCHYPETPSLSTLPSRTWKSAPLAWVQAHRSVSSHLKVGHCYTFPVENESVLFSASLVPQVKFGRKQEVRARVCTSVCGRRSVLSCLQPTDKVTVHKGVQHWSGIWCYNVWLCKWTGHTHKKETISVKLQTCTTHLNGLFVLCCTFGCSQNKKNIYLRGKITEILSLVFWKMPPN